MKRTTQRKTRRAAPRELPVEVRQPDKVAKRLALLTIIGLVIVLGVVGALLELFVAPLFATDIQFTTQRHTYAPVTNELDFLIQMVPHHQEAVDTAKLVASTTTDPKLKTFAQAIVTAQAAEIVQMNAWIDAWYPGQRYAHSYTPMSFCCPSVICNASRLPSGANDRLSQFTGVARSSVVAAF